MRSQSWLTDPFPGLSSLDFPLYFISYLFLVQSNSCFLLTFFQGQVKKSKEKSPDLQRPAGRVQSMDLKTKTYTLHPKALP